MKVPLEILIEIFTLATRSRGSAASWILYQRRSKLWFEKQLYAKVVLFDEEEAALFLQCLRSRQMYEEFATMSVKAMSLSGDVNVATIIEILSLCKGINNLYLRPYRNVIDNDVAPLMTILDTLPLQVLSLQIGVPVMSCLTSNITAFDRITHLESDDTSMLLDVPMSSFPQLTHLSLWGSSNKSGTDISSLVTNILSHPTVQVVVFRVEHHQQFADVLDRHNLNDTRIVLATPRRYLWDDLGRSCMLFWELAQEKAALREPNHNNHRCFTRSALTNGVRDYMGIDRVPEDHPDYEIVRTNVIGANGRVRATYVGTTPTSSTFIEESDDDMEVEYSDDDLEVEYSDDESDMDHTAGGTDDA
ncbi:hypothetical protein BDR06DRAFT_1015505 [Suillus hirtellus]|nr:hypothetical protein BDR06DRAFT_1015505 [Suillus hirtellus]